MNLAQLFREELASESSKTRRALERAPDGQFGWKPHEKSFTLGQLTSHLAEIYHWGTVMLTTERLDMNPGDPRPPVADNRAELLKIFDANMADLNKAIATVDDASLAIHWKMTFAGNPFLDAPRHKVFRDWVFAHGAHHRGQLTVYLRLLHVPVPALFGPTADEP